MKHVILVTIWFMVIIGISLRYEGKVNSLQQEIDNYKGMEDAYFKHLKECDSIGIFYFGKMTKADAG